MTLNPDEQWNPMEEEPATEGGVPPSEEAAQLRAELEEAERERAQFRNLAQRVQADFANYKRRVEEEREELQRHTNAGLILKLLPVLDDFQRALEHIPQEAAEASWLEGVLLIEKKLATLLESEGVSRIEAVGHPFDPHEHEALFHEETDEYPPGHVVGVLQEGYRLHGKVLRPAQVSVARASSGQGEETEREE